MQIEIIYGDLFTTEADAIAHGCNCLGIMGAGVALKMRTTFPTVYEAYKEFCKFHKYDKAILPGLVQFIPDTTPSVYNLFTQYEMGRHAKLEYVNAAFSSMFIHAEKEGIQTIAIPQVGAGIGGLKWEDVLYEIERAEQENPWSGTLKIVVKD